MDTGFWWGTLRQSDHLENPGGRWEDNIKMDLQKVECEGMEWNDLAQVRDRWRAILNFGFHKMRENSSLAENRLASQEIFCPRD